MKRAIFVIVAVLGIAVPLASQSFQVASIKKNTTSDRRLMRSSVQPGGRWVGENAPTRMLIQDAYQMPAYRVLGGPDWIDSDRYDVEAKAEGPATPDEMRRMEQALLAERFGLKVHPETRELAVYELSVLKSGLKLKPANEENCLPASVTPAPGETPRTRCGRVAIQINNKGTHMYGSEITMADLIRGLSVVLARNIIDKTEFKGTFNLDMPFLADDSAPGLPNPGPGLFPPPDPTAVTIFTAIQEFGLKLDSAKGPVDVIVIDSIERPSEN